MHSVLPLLLLLLLCSCHTSCQDHLGPARADVTGNWQLATGNWQLHILAKFRPSCSRPSRFRFDSFGLVAAQFVTLLPVRGMFWMARNLWKPGTRIQPGQKTRSTPPHHLRRGQPRLEVRSTETEIICHFISIL